MSLTKRNFSLFAVLTLVFASSITARAVHEEFTG